MFDYYRVRFKQFTKPPHPVYDTPPHTGAPVKMPRPLAAVSWLSCILAAVGVALAAAIGKSDAERLPPALFLPILLTPVTVTLAAGFAEQQAWTRPLLIALLVALSVASLIIGLFVIASFFLISSCCVALYLYRSSHVRAYYSSLSDLAVLRLELSDLGKLEFVPLYVGGLAIVAGVLAAWYLAGCISGSGMSLRGLGDYDLYGVVLAATLFGSIFGALGKLLGEAIASRLNRRRLTSRSS